MGSRTRVGFEVELLLPAKILLLLSLTAAVRSFAVTSPPPVSAYDILRSYNFPPGLLPKGATGYDLDPATGKFTVYFDGTCSFSLQGSYDIRYKSQVSGRISDGKLTDLKGISVKILFLWINIVEVERNNDELEFSVGILSASFTIDNFEVIPQCGCGLDCVNLGEDPNPIRLRGSL